MCKKLQRIPRVKNFLKFRFLCGFTLKQGFSLAKKAGVEPFSPGKLCLFACLFVLTEGLSQEQRSIEYAPKM